MSLENRVEAIERVLAVVLPSILIIAIVINMTNEQTARRDLEEGLLVSFDLVGDSESIDIRDAVETLSRFILVFVSNDCPSCSELLKRFDSTLIGQYTEGLCTVILVSSDSLATRSKLQTERHDIVLVEDREGQLFAEFSIGVVPSYIAVSSSSRKALKSSRALAVLDWLTVRPDRLP